MSRTLASTRGGPRVGGGFRCWVTLMQISVTVGSAAYNDVIGAAVSTQDAAYTTWRIGCDERQKNLRRGFR